MLDMILLLPFSSVPPANTVAGGDASVVRWRSAPRQRSSKDCCFGRVVLSGNYKRGQVYTAFIIFWRYAGER